MELGHYWARYKPSGNTPGTNFGDPEIVSVEDLGTDDDPWIVVFCTGSEINSGPEEYEFLEKISPYTDKMSGVQNGPSNEKSSI